MNLWKVKNVNNEQIEVLKTAKEYMENLDKAIVKTAEYLQNEDYYNGMDLVIKISDGLEWIVKLIASRNDIYKKDMKINEFNDKIKEIVEALKNQDYILIGDLLEYEIKPIIEDYCNKTDSMIRKMN